VECFSLDIRTGILRCEREHIYPITNGIARILPGALDESLPLLRPHLDQLPRDLKDAVLSRAPKAHHKFQKYFVHTQRSFSSEWKSVSSSDDAWGLDPSSRKQIFLRCFEILPSNLDGKKVLNIGCGHGEVELALLKTGAEVFATDMSWSVDDVQRRVRDAEPEYASAVHISQTNLHQCAFEEKEFDFVHCAGVLHHTPSTRRGFDIISSCVRDGGKCYIEVYSAELKDPKSYNMNKKLRKISVRLPHLLLHVLCYFGAYYLWLFSNYRFTKDAALRDETTGEAVYRKNSIAVLELSLFDNFSPAYQHHHTTDEVKNWFASLGYVGVKKTFVNPSGFGVVGTMRSNNSA